jgi:hypothetical protein
MKNILLMLMLCFMQSGIVLCSTKGTKKPVAAKMPAKSAKAVDSDSDGSDIDASLARTTKKLELGDGEAPVVAISPIPKFCFSPGIEQFILDLIARVDATKPNSNINGAMFHFTLYTLAQAFANKCQEGAPTRFVVDKDYKRNYCLPLRLMAKAGVQLFCNGGVKHTQASNAEYEEMHHKFLIFNNINDGGVFKRLLVTGSYNYTGGSEVQNYENVVIVKDEESIAAFIQQFGLLLGNSVPIGVGDCVTDKSKFKDRLTPKKNGQIAYALKLNKIPYKIPAGQENNPFINDGKYTGGELV